MEEPTFFPLGSNACERERRCVTTIGHRRDGPRLLSLSLMSTMSQMPQDGRRKQGAIYSELLR